MWGFLCNKVAFDELCMGGRTVSETQSWIIKRQCISNDLINQCCDHFINFSPLICMLRRFRCGLLDSLTSKT